ncbi:hypothetical protein WJX73_005105 [Symbiochloris irregularis]|uniref:ARC6 IMS domain-containing protein n=1 Tax=Symbiochloris irregularis TaxID=706552 RepID=A0AAW1Q2E2_9CHLO
MAADLGAQQLSQSLDAKTAAISIPVDYSQLLGLRARDSYLDPQLIHAFEEISGKSLVDEGFTKQAEQGRAVILEEAVGELRRRRGRGTSGVDAASSQGFLVDWGLLPGTLALLQEVGEAEVTLEVGKSALSDSKAGPFKRDILLAMALAHCTLASSAFSSQDQIVAGCSHLAEAGKCLKQGGAPPLAAELVREIEDALHDLQAPALLEQLKMPPSASTANARRAALASLKALLADPAAAAKRDGSPMIDAPFASLALARLTAPELVNLLDWQSVAANNAASIPWAFPGMLKSAAIAHMITGVVQRRPSLVHKGEALLQNISPASETLVERVVVKVLLGAPEAASGLLQEAETASASAKPPWSLGSASRASDPTSQSSISQVGRSTEGDQGLLPGLCLLTERWLSEVALKQFWVQEERPPPSSLQAYFQDAKVTSYLAGSGEEGESLKGRLGVLLDQVSQGLQRWRDPPLTPPSADSAASLSAPEARLRTPLLTAAGLTIVAVGIMFVGGLLPVRGPSNQTPRHRKTTAAAAAAGTATRETHSQQPLTWQRATGMEQRLTQPVAEAVIRRWQAAKKYALGPRHDISTLSGVVAEPWLSVVIKDAAAAEQSGWFWTYKLDSLEVVKVEVKPAKRKGLTARTATVSARLHERGDLWSGMGKRVEDASYANPYTVEYTMQFTPEQGWRISNTLVLGDAQ